MEQATTPLGEATPQQSPGTPEQQRAAEEWVAHFAEGWRAPTDPDSFAAHFEQVLDPQVRLIQPQIPDLVGHRALREGFVKPLFGLMDGLRGTVDRWAADGDLIYIELTLHGNLGGRPAEFESCDVVTLRDGVAIERKAYVDPVPLLATIATRPRAWPAFARYQLQMIRQRIGRKSR
jgi:ketosteroid isomerase-like protein